MSKSMLILKTEKDEIDEYGSGILMISLNLQFSNVKFKFGTSLCITFILCLILRDYRSGSNVS